MLRLIFLITVCCFVSACTPKVHKGEVVIMDLRNAKDLPTPDLTSHKPYEVEAGKIVGIAGQEYEVTYYENINGILQWHRGAYGSTEDFDRAAYNWLSDTSVSIRLFNTSTQKELTFKLYGKDNRNGMDDGK
jgi:hypothetical protein